MGKKVGIVIVNYNGEKYQNDALKSIYESTFQDFEVIIVDSGSKDNSIALAKEQFPQVHCLLQNENVGVAKGNNIGIRYAIEQLDTEYVLLLNNDIVMDPKNLEHLVAHADEKTITVPKIYYYEPNDMLWFAGGGMIWNRGEPIHFGNFETDHGQYDEMKPIDYSPTCCMLIHRSVFQQVGYIDEDIFMYCDDTDFCTRVIEAGITILYVPQGIMWHKVSSSGGGMDSKVTVYYVTRNKLYYMRKYKSRMPLAAYLYTYAKLLAKFVLSPVYKKNDKYIFKACVDFIKGRMGRCDTL